MALITCKECGAEISDKAVTCPKCGAPLQEIPGVIEEEKEDSIEQWLDLRWLCFILPPLGPILYLIQKDDSPEKAKKYLEERFIKDVSVLAGGPVNIQFNQAFEKFINYMKGE